MKYSKVMFVLPFIVLLLFNPSITQAYIIDVSFSFSNISGNNTKNVSISSLPLGVDDVDLYCSEHNQGCSSTWSGNNYDPLLIDFSVIPEQGDSLVGDVRVQWDFSGFHTVANYSYFNMTGPQNENHTSVSATLSFPMNNIEGIGSYVFTAQIGTQYSIWGMAHNNFHEIGAWSTPPTLVDENSYGTAYFRSQTYAGSSSLYLLPEPATMLLFCAGLAGLGIIGRRFKF